MSFSTRVDAAVLMAPTADSVRTSLATAITDAETAIGAVLTTAGFASGSTQRAVLEDRLVDVARETASELVNHS